MCMSIILPTHFNAGKKGQTLLNQKDMGKLCVRVLGVYTSLPELYEKQGLFQKSMQIFSRMLYHCPNILLPGMK